jgi:hypothetical protein
VPGTGESTLAPVTLMCEGGLTSTCTCSAVRPAVSVRRCCTFAGSYLVEPTREEDTVIDGLATAAAGSARSSSAASASERGIAQLDHTACASCGRRGRGSARQVAEATARTIAAVTITPL